MKRTLLFLATGLFMTALAAGSALAADTPPGQPSPKASQAQGQQDSSGSRQRSQSTATGLPFEAPWISLALANSQSIGLTAEQQRTLEALRSDFQQRAARQQESIEKAELDLERILSAPSVDLEQVRTQLNTIGALRTAARLSRIETLIKARAVLSPDQQAKLQAAVAKESEGHGSMMRRRHGSGDGYRETE